MPQCGHDSCSSRKSLKTKAGEQEPPWLKSFHPAEPKLITVPGEHRGSRNYSARTKNIGESGFVVDSSDGENRWITAEERRQTIGGENNERGRMISFYTVSLLTAHGSLFLVGMFKFSFRFFEDFNLDFVNLSHMKCELEL